MSAAVHRALVLRGRQEAGGAARSVGRRRLILQPVLVMLFASQTNLRPEH